MCGIAGVWDRRRRASPDALAALARRDDRHACSIAGRTRAACGATRERGSRSATAGSRSSICRRPARSRWSRRAAASSSPINGEVYNVAELRARARGGGAALPRPLRHRGDRRGRRGVGRRGRRSKRLIGMFAMALWDRRERVLYLVRDRLGIKPLYWADFDGRLLFGSELKALRADPGWTPALDRDALAAYPALRLCAGAAHDLSRRAASLPPGTILTAARGRRARDRAVLVARQMSRAQGQAARLDGSEDEAADGARRAAARRGRAAHGRRRAAGRVPLGRHRFLDRGRADAGAKHAAGAQLHDRLPRAGLRRGAARRRRWRAHLGTDHTELYVSPEHALDGDPAPARRCMTSRSPTARRSRPSSSRR